MLFRSTKYLNQIFTVSRATKDAATGSVTMLADYSELGGLFWAVVVIGLVVPLATVHLVRRRLMVSESARTFRHG